MANQLNYFFPLIFELASFNLKDYALEMIQTLIVHLQEKIEKDQYHLGIIALDVKFSCNQAMNLIRYLFPV